MRSVGDINNVIKLEFQFYISKSGGDISIRGSVGCICTSNILIVWHDFDVPNRSCYQYQKPIPLLCILGMWRSSFLGRKGFISCSKKCWKDCQDLFWSLAHGSWIRVLTTEKWMRGLVLYSLTILKSRHLKMKPILSAGSLNWRRIWKWCNIRTIEIISTKYLRLMTLNVMIWVQSVCRTLWFSDTI